MPTGSVSLFRTARRSSTPRPTFLEAFATRSVRALASWSACDRIPCGSASGAQDARVVSNQWLGDQTHIALDVGGKLLIAVSHAPVSAKSGERLRYAIAPENLHVFDADAGAALSHGLEAA